MAWFGDFRSEVREKTRASDLALIFSVPVLLSLIFLLPQSIQASLILDYGNYSIFNLWSSAYVHRGFDHFSNNLGAYCVLIGPIYLLFVLADEPKLFRYTLLTLLLILPFVISLSNIAALGSGTGAGFSGIGSALFGLLPVSLFLFIHNKVSEDIEPAHGVVLFLTAVAIITWIYAGVTAAAGILLFAALLTIYDISQVSLEEVREAAAELSSMEGYFELVMIAGLLFLLSPLMLFPQNIAQDGTTVNILSHYLGLLIGFFGPIIYLDYRRRRQ
ncbi:hypothetical protein [Halorubrum sp. CGM4_25_10-8A]|uniref:hypothetical protein n=1 Tax=Halorubrum sp. CGM4_25_10-8A TaxID=2518116 RepID=UPI0010F45784|nr:hypothetical protein [Halorubrum sp. CGM4_25_10-8A]TKX38082.1 hypothetical protein EXE52_13665 [Halorubrum sp. CGM4_25_10-8A]